MKKWLFAVPFLLVLVPTVARAQVNDTYVIAAAADAAGANGTRWATEFHLFNPQSHALKVRLVYLPTGGTQGRRVDFTVAPNGTAFAENVVDDVFEMTGTGALLVATFPEDNPTVPNDVLSRSFVVNSKTFNNASAGTFGQSIPGTWVGLFDFATDPISAVASGVTDSASTTSGSRANVGAVNLGRFTATLKVSVYNSSGATIASLIPFVLPPQGHFQQRLPVHVEHGTVEFFVDDPNRDAVVFPYVSVVDNRSGDPTYIQPVLLASGGSLFKRAAVTTHNPGRKIDNNIARSVMANAEFHGEVAVSPMGVMSTKNRR